MNEPLKDTTSPVPNESSQSNAQPQSQTHPSDRAAPLHERLPLEMFVAIIHLCVGFSTPVRDLVALQLVCRSWHDVIADTGFLWGTINAAEGLPAVRKALQMAKDSLIDINVINPGREIDQTQFFNLARGKLNQWRSFVVEWKHWRSALDDLRTQKPPKLDKLHVATSYDPRGEEIVLFGGDPTPGLKDVRLVRIPISLAPLRLSGLKSLHLEGIPSVSVIEVVAIITESPGLESLHLDSLKGAVIPTDATPGQLNVVSSSPIELAFLIELSLRFLPLSFLSYLVLTVAFPQLRSLRVESRLNENPAVQLGETAGLNRLNPSMNSIASGARLYKVTLSGWGYYLISIGGLDIIVWLSGRPGLSLDHFLETFTWLSGHLKQSLRDLPLHLDLDNRGQEPSYLEWFTRSTNVTTLSLYSDRSFSPSLENIIRTISRPTSPRASSPTWLFPQVEVLSTNCVGIVDNVKIVDMIEKRQSASRGSFGAGINGALPKRFREVWLAYGGIEKPAPDTEFMSQVVQAAAGADVYWEEKKWIGS